MRRSPEYPAVISNAKPSLHIPLNYGILARIDIRSHIRVGRRGVNIQDIDKIAVPSMLHENDNVILVVDEIGKMECFSGLFRQTLMKILDATNTV